MTTEATPIEIVAEFNLGGVPHDAVRVHQESEEHVLGEEAIRRAEAGSQGHVVRSEEDWRHAYEHCSELPLALDDFWLATARPYPGYPRDVSSLSRGSREWYESWDALGGAWSRGALVLRRRTA